jgi:Gpi18-like mannosyltransferase
MDKMTTQRTAWREAAWIFLLSRLAIVFISLLSTIALPLMGQNKEHLCVTAPQTCLFSWWRWDAVVYVEIARHGYTIMYHTVFFPLWPLLIHSVASMLGDSITIYYIVGLILANLLFYLALVVFYWLLGRDFDGTTARNALFYLAFGPYALFFFAGYSEALFLLLSLTVFLCLQRKKWLLAGIAGFFAALTRSPGILLTIPFAITFLQRFWFDQTTIASRRENMKALLSPAVLAHALPMLLIPLGVATFMLYLDLQHYSPLAFSQQEALYWHRSLSFPLNGICSAFYHLFIHPELIEVNLPDLLFTILPLAILILGWKRLPLHYSLFALVMVLFLLSYPHGSSEPLIGTPRYMLVIFPITIICAQWAKNPRFDRAFQVIALPMFALNIVLFLNHHWVA